MISNVNAKCVFVNQVKSLHDSHKFLHSKNKSCNIITYMAQKFTFYSRAVLCSGGFVFLFALDCP